MRSEEVEFGTAGLPRRRPLRHDTGRRRPMLNKDRNSADKYPSGIRADHLAIGFERADKLVFSRLAELAQENHDLRAELDLLRGRP